ncbi:MAG: site-2 protease family protein [Candidatus Latescibacteria bacterium]|nr:site-2 protease family protein [Candidatus Latescibacterota bacterium]
MPDIADFLQRLVLTAPPLLFALTVHEYAHSVTADRLGDPTGRLLGRSTLNPFAHLDPIGTFLLFFANFGWGKPVPVDPRNFRRPRTDMAVVAFAGPLSNVFTALLFAALFRLMVIVPFTVPGTLAYMTRYGVQISLVLVFFNLLPFPPLDGSRILTGLLPPRMAIRFQEMERTLTLILPVLILLEVFLRVPIFWGIMGPAVTTFHRLLIG